MTAVVAIVEITDASGRVLAPDWLARSEPVHRQLRPALPEDYAGEMQRIFDGGARMCVAATGGQVTGVALYRVYANTASGLRLYIDDLVTDAACRSTGVGRTLLRHLEGLARRAGCGDITLVSGTQRTRSHKFYFREGMVVSSFHFTKRLA